jgi:2,3-bisphosphoglycerate-independent phosphoglycerate mutase
MATGPHMLILLDGFGYSQEHAYNAIYSSHAPTFTQLQSTFPSSLLHASGSFVGLLPKMIGNSEVGHLTIGSGRIIKQPVTQLCEAIEDGSFFTNALLIQRFQELREKQKTLHLLGLLSDAGGHSHSMHLFALLQMAVAQGVQKILVHPFLDGRDTPPQAATFYLNELDYILKQLKVGEIGTLHGRFYAMDRDNHASRIAKSHTILTQPHIPRFTTWQEALTASYAQGITDEFFEPCTLSMQSFIQPDDGILFFNIRADRSRELTQAFMHHRDHYSWIITATNYGPDFPVDVLLTEPLVQNTLLDSLEQADKSIFTIAETEKYAHVTYFFNGGKEILRRQEKRILIPSKRHYKTYAPIPCMSAPEITEAVSASLHFHPQDFYLINYANADMVGHSGDFDATCKAIACLDRQLKHLYDIVVEKLNGTLYITADHGKAETMYDPVLRQPRTAHTTNKVPFLFIKKELMNTSSQLPLTELAHIAPFILEQLELAIPLEMKKLDFHY